MRAKLKSQNGIVWGLITAVAYFFCMAVGMYFVIYNFCNGVFNISAMSSMDKKTQDAALQQMVQTIAANPLHVITITMFGVGGYLLVRYILDKKPDKKEPEVHWMDKIGKQ